MTPKRQSAGEAVLAAAAGTSSAPGNQPTPPNPAEPDPAAVAAAAEAAVQPEGAEAVPAGFPPVVTDPETEAGEDQRVPLDRFQQVTTQNKEMRERLAKLEEEEQKRQREQMTELQRAEAERDEERQKREAAEQKALDLERGGYLRSAAAAAGFADPEDAVALIGLSEIEDQLAAQQAVTELAQKKPHLIASGKPGPTPIGNPLPGNGATPQPGDDDPKRQVGRDLLGMLTGKK